MRIQENITVFMLRGFEFKEMNCRHEKMIQSQIQKKREKVYEAIHLPASFARLVASQGKADAAM